LNTVLRAALFANRREKITRLSVIALARRRQRFGLHWRPDACLAMHSDLLFGGLTAGQSTDGSRSEPCSRYDVTSVASFDELDRLSHVGPPRHATRRLRCRRQLIDRYWPS